MLTSTQLRKLEAIQRRVTHYEVVAIKNTATESRTVLIGYTAQHSRRGLIQMMQKNGEAVLALTDPKGELDIAWNAPACRGAQIGDWNIRFCRRTEREAVIGGEFVFVVDAAKAAA